jgi:hypothetical protein
MFDITAIFLLSAVGFWSAAALAEQQTDADLNFEMELSAPYLPVEEPEQEIISTEDDLEEIIAEMDDEDE